MMGLLWFVVNLLLSSGEGNNILKVDPKDNKVGVLASTSHNYIGATSPQNIAVLFDITTLENMSHDQETTRRQPYELAIVLDRSGSMNGAKLKQAKLAIISILDNMIDGDIIHIIQYDHDVQVVVNNGHYDIRNEIIQKVNSIYCGGATNVFGGLSAAYDLIRDNINKNTRHSRIFLFSDGLLNSGITDHKVILDHIAQWKNNLDLTISSFAIGYEPDRKLMTSIAETGRGDFFFIESAKSIANIVDIARKDAASIVGTDAVLTIKTMNVSQNVEIRISNLFDRQMFDLQKYPKFNQMDISDLRAGDSKYAIVELFIDPTQQYEGDYMDILEWKLQYKDVAQIQNEYSALSGKVGIKVVNENDDRLKAKENINEHIKVFWRLNEIRTLDKEVLESIENEDYDQAVHRRKLLNEQVQDLKRSEYYGRFTAAPLQAPSNAPSQAPTFNAGAYFESNQAIIRRMEDDKIQQQMDDLEDKMNKKQKVSKKQKEAVLMDVGATYHYSLAPSSSHNEL